MYSVYYSGWTEMYFNNIIINYVCVSLRIPLFIRVINRSNWFSNAHTTIIYYILDVGPDYAPEV